MGLNSLKYIIYMKIYYIPEIKINNIDLSQLTIHKKYIQKIILTPYGRIIIKKNKQNEKLMVNESSEISDFYKNYTLYINDVNWVKTYNNNISNENDFLEKTVYEIKLNEKSSTTLILEYIDDIINDLFFISNNEYNTVFFKDDISSFIKMLI
mgnify:CR=1 FL=1|jgi:hypothetical protein